MKNAWGPIAGEILLLLLAVLLFLILYDCFNKGKRLKESISERLALFFGLGWVIYIVGALAVMFLVYSIFFE